MQKTKYTNISYAIPVCNEVDELQRLLFQLNDWVDTHDQIVIQTDADNVTAEVISFIEYFKGVCKCELDVVSFALRNDFAAFKNHLKSYCTKDYVFQIDADEFLGDGLLMHLPLLIKENPDIDLFYLPRINIVTGLTDDYAKSQNWRVDRIEFPIAKPYDYNVINYPDVQARLMRNDDTIYWKNAVHEIVVGAKSYSNLGIMEVTSDFEINDIQNWCLIHIKTIDRQKRQNEFYETLLKR